MTQPTILKFFTKDPDATLDYMFDWSIWLDTGETIATFTLTPSAGLTVESSQLTDSDKKVVAWVSGGVSKLEYITCHIETNMGRIDDRTLGFDIIQR